MEFFLGDKIIHLILSYLAYILAFVEKKLPKSIKVLSGSAVK